MQFGGNGIAWYSMVQPILRHTQVDSKLAKKVGLQNKQKKTLTCGFMVWGKGPLAGPQRGHFFAKTPGTCRGTCVHHWVSFIHKKAPGGCFWKSRSYMEMPAINGGISHDLIALKIMTLFRWPMFESGKQMLSTRLKKQPELCPG